MTEELVIMRDQQAVTTSLQVAENFGKDHKNVLQSIKNLAAENSATKIHCRKLDSEKYITY